MHARCTRVVEEPQIMSKMENVWPQGQEYQNLFAQVKRGDADKESTIVSFETPPWSSSAFLSMTWHHRSAACASIYSSTEISCGDHFGDMQRPSNLTITGFHYFMAFDCSRLL